MQEHVLWPPDAGGLVVIGAAIQAVNTATNISYSAQTNDDGIYNLPSLLPGTYNLTVQKEGFQKVVSDGIQLHVADSIAINFTLQVGFLPTTRVRFGAWNGGSI